MNTSIRLVWIGLLLGWSSCNRFDDQQPTPDHGPPPGAVQALTQQYPQAQRIVFTTIATNQLWAADFVQHRRRYQALVSPARLLTADQLIDGEMADSLTRLLGPTVVAGGTFSNPRLRDYEWDRVVIHPNGLFMYSYADYTWQRQPYTVYWSIAWPPSGKPFYNIHLLPFHQAEYHTKTLTDLPELIQTALRAQDLTFTHAIIQVDASRKRRYTLSVRQLSAPPTDQYWQLSYDDNGQLLAATNQYTAQYFKQLDQLPPAVQQYLQRPELVGFGLNGVGGQFGSFARHTYGSMVTYQVNVEKDKQAWVMLFSGEGQLISRTFQTYGSF